MTEYLSSGSERAEGTSDGLSAAEKYRPLWPLTLVSFARLYASNLCLRKIR